MNIMFVINDYVNEREAGCIMLLLSFSECVFHVSWNIKKIQIIEFIQPYLVDGVGVLLSILSSKADVMDSTNCKVAPLLFRNFTIVIFFVCVVPPAYFSKNDNVEKI